MHWYGHFIRIQYVLECNQQRSEHIGLTVPVRSVQIYRTYSLFVSSKNQQMCHSCKLSNYINALITSSNKVQNHIKHFPWHAFSSICYSDFSFPPSICIHLYTSNNTNTTFKYVPMSSTISFLLSDLLPVLESCHWEANELDLLPTNQIILIITYLCDHIRTLSWIWDREMSLLFF